MSDLVDEFVFGVDLDGVCADFYAKMREIFAEWRNVPVEDLTTEVSWGFPEWGMLPTEYERLHRFAVTQRQLFDTVPVIPGAPQAIRRLGTEGVRVRIITHRLFLRHFHKMAVAQTVEWLDRNGIPYWDLCFMRDKAMVDSDIYVEDSPSNVEKLVEAGREVICFTNSTNRNLSPAPVLRADDWDEVEEIVRERYYTWRTRKQLGLPEAPGHPPAAATCDCGTSSAA